LTKLIKEEFGKLQFEGEEGESLNIEQTVKDFGRPANSFTKDQTNVNDLSQHFSNLIREDKDLIKLFGSEQMEANELICNFRSFVLNQLF